MKSIIRFILVAVIALSCSAYSSNAQVFVRIRPERPRYERIVAPSPHHIWIDEEWEPRSGAYVFIGGRWAEPPHPGWIWIPGHWKQGRNGWYWKPGHWRHL